MPLRRTWPSGVGARQGWMRAALLRLEGVKDWQLFAFAVLWVLVGGVVLQLIVLPLLIPWAHWGHGLITDLDSLGYHNWALEQALRIRQQGWSAWELRPLGHFTPGVASVLYVLIRPEPWVMLPLNAVFFGLAVTAVRVMLSTVSGSRGIGLAAVVPFLAYPSFVPIWGQLQKDVVTGAGLCIVLCAVIVGGRGPRTGLAMWGPAGAALGGLAVVWLARPYGTAIVGAVAAGAAILAGCRRHADRGSLAIVTGVLLLGSLVTLEPWQLRGALPSDNTAAIEADPSLAAATSEEMARRSRQALQRIAVMCSPFPSGGIIDSLLFSVCSVRANFIGYADRVNASSGYDYERRLRTAAEFVAYLPRAFAHALLAPWPTLWGTERTPLGKLASVFVPFEMLIAYAAFVLAVFSTWQRPPSADVWAIIAFCVAYAVTYAYATPQVGTLYRMRAFVFTILVATSLSVFLRQLPAPLNDDD